MRPSHKNAHNFTPHSRAPPHNPTRAPPFTAFPQNVATKAQSWVARQHFLVRVTIFAVSSSLVAWLLLEGLQWYEGYLECGLDIQRKLGPMCMNLGNLQLTVANNVNLLINFAFYEMTLSIAVLFAWLAGLLG